MLKLDGSRLFTPSRLILDFMRKQSMGMHYKSTSQICAVAKTRRMWQMMVETRLPSHQLIVFFNKETTTRNNFQCLHSRATEENRLCRGPHSNFFFEAAVSECSTNIFKFISDLIYVNINCIKWHCQWRKESKSKQLYRECWHLRRSFYILYSMEYKYTTHLGCSSTA